MPKHPQPRVRSCWGVHTSKSPRMRRTVPAFRTRSFDGLLRAARGGRVHHLMAGRRGTFVPCVPPVRGRRVAHAPARPCDLGRPPPHVRRTRQRPPHSAPRRRDDAQRPSDRSGTEGIIRLVRGAGIRALSYGHRAKDDGRREMLGGLCR